MTRHGPACLAADGYFKPRLLIITGHISFHPSMLSRVRPTSFASVVFLREPLARLVSLFNMYPDGTFGLPPQQLLARHQVQARLSPSVRGAQCPDVLCERGEPVRLGGRTLEAGQRCRGGALRRARFNLLHRYDVFGITERAEESMAMVAWAFGWLPMLERSPQLRAALRPHEQKRIAPGSEHRRLNLVDLCAEAPALVARMRIQERSDRLLYRFARVVYAQRLGHLPQEALGLMRGDDVAIGGNGGGGGGGGGGAQTTANVASRVAVADNETASVNASAPPRASSLEAAVRVIPSCWDSDDGPADAPHDAGSAGGDNAGGLVVDEEDSAAYA